MSPQEYCQTKAAASGSSFYYSFLFLPKDRREAITALYAFCREVDDIADECTDIHIARTKLAWWRTEVANLYAENPQHPVTKALSSVIHTYDLNEEHFQEIIDGMEMDLEQNRYADFKQLQLYCYRVASVVGLLSASIFGFSNRNSLKYAHDLGLAFQLTNIIRDMVKMHVETEFICRWTNSHSSASRKTTLFKAANLKMCKNCLISKLNAPRATTIAHSMSCLQKTRKRNLPDS